MSIFSNAQLADIFFMRISNAPLRQSTVDTTTCKWLIEPPSAEKGMMTSWTFKILKPRGSNQESKSP